jgi:hypothetical protein
MENVKDLNYYVPTPDEIHIGLKYEIREWIDTPRGPKEEWISKEWSEYDCLADIMNLFEYDDLRVAYIKQKDLYELGFVKIDDYIYKLDIFTIQRLTPNRWRLKVDDAYDLQITIKNITDLSKLIAQLFYNDL